MRPLRLSGRGFSLSELLNYHLFQPFFDWQLSRWLPLIVLALALGCYLVYLLALSLADGSYRVPFLGFLLVVLPSTLLSIDMASAPRYAFAPSVMLFTVLVNEAGRRKRPVSRAVACTFLVLIAFSCITGFRSRIFYSSNFPDWRREVSAWRSDRSRPVKIWPQFPAKSWQIVLPASAK